MISVLSETDEPFKNLLTQGMVNKDGKKMSKSLGKCSSVRRKSSRNTVRIRQDYSFFSRHRRKDELDWSDAGVEGMLSFPETESGDWFTNSRRNIRKYRQRLRSRPKLTNL